MSHQLVSDECELDEHESCDTFTDCAACDPPNRPCVCICHQED